MKQIFDKSIENVPVKLSDLTLHPENPRKEYRDITILAGSLEKNGQINPIVIDEYGQILSGNRRFLAGKQLGWEYLKADIKVGLDEFTKKSILITTNITQKSINVWENRDLIAETYWGSFLETYEQKSQNDKGYSSFAKCIGISTVHVKRIVEASAEENKEWVGMLRQSNLPSGLIDTILQFPQKRRKPICLEIIEKSNKEPNMTRDRLRVFARQLNRNMGIEKSDKYGKHTFGRMLTIIRTYNKHLVVEHIDKFSNEQKIKLKEKLQHAIDYYNKL